MFNLKKIKRAVKIGGYTFAFLTVISNTLRKIEWKIKEKRLLMKHDSKNQIKKKILNFEMYLNPKRGGIENQLLVNGDREKLAVNAFRKELKQGDVLLEAGANIGYYTLIGSKKIGKGGKIYAVEPSSKNLAKLQKNLELNNIKNVKFFHNAFGNFNGKTNLYISHSCNMNQVKEGISEVNFDKNKLLEKEKIKIITIDKFLKKKKKPTVIRMDVEGYEYEIVNGMKKLLVESPPRLLYIEVHPKAMGVKKYYEFLNILKTSKYKLKHCFFYDTSSTDLRFLRFLDKFRMKILNKKKVMLSDLLKRSFDLDTNASYEAFFEHISKNT